MELEFEAKIVRNGTSAYVLVPAWVLKAEKLNVGDTVKVKVAPKE